jgi:uncharacterized protein YrrD
MEGEYMNQIQLDLQNMDAQSTQELIGKPVISVTNGQNIATIVDFMIDPEKLSLSALVTSKGSILSRKIEAIRAADIQVWGMHTVLVKDHDVILKEDELYDRDAWMSFLDDLKAREVVTIEGTRLGTIKDLLVDRRGNMLAYELSKMYKSGQAFEGKLILTEATQSLGKDILVVDLKKALKTEEPVQVVQIQENQEGA